VTEFRAGSELARTFYADVVSRCVDVPHTACLIGEGSEVLGYDSSRSTDHEWGPRVQLFVAAEHVDRVRQTVRNGLPAEFGGYPTSWYSLAQGRVAHHVEISTLADWLRSHFRIDLRGGLDYAAWLSFPQQHLLQLTQGTLFRDDDGELTKLRTSLAWYPTDVWRWLLATQWDLISIEQPFLGRTVEAGDARVPGCSSTAYVVSSWNWHSCKNVTTGLMANGSAPLLTN
jgi:hypothetical protein